MRSIQTCSPALRADATPDLRHRRMLPELMDDPSLDPAEHARALRELARLNFVSRSAAILWRPIRKLIEARTGEPLRVLDIATGGGDVPLALARLARRAGAAIELHACDISPVAIAQAARRAERDRTELHLFACDALALDQERAYDVVMCSLFLHHLDEERAARLLRIMSAAARRLVLVNDLQRCRRGYLAAWAVSRLLTRSRVTRVDAPRSVVGAFTIEEVLGLAERAGLSGATIEPCWPFRFLLSWTRA